ncbi:MAG TPA: Ig-like domain-containing protein [Patescibacteria group bacterium]|nr:Ig-like domain-containing protein [Patescibacteria group bacterium]
MLQWMTFNFNQKRRTAGLLGVLFLAVFFVLLFYSFPVEAQTLTSNEAGVGMIEQPLGLPSTDIRIIIARIIRAALGLLGIILLVIIIYAGFLWMTAGGNDEQIGKAKNIIKNGVIGLIIIMSAYAITQFIISSLLGAMGGPVRGPGVNIVQTTNFQGSGALGKVIRDHYPTRNQTDVPRNTSIIITFTKPINPESFIDDTTGDGILGNCEATVDNWWADCDRVKMTDNALTDNLINIKKTIDGQSIQGAVALTSSSTINGVSGIYTLVLKPITNGNEVSGGYLGSSNEEVAYSVRLGAGIQLNERNGANQYVSAFEQRILGNNYYEWQFTTSKFLDNTPPTVKNVFPENNSTEPKNSAIQIEFSEAMNPIGLQGNFRLGGDYYYIEGWNVFLRALSSDIPIGSFNLVSNYRILEFVSERECGINSCGNQIFCLPVCDARDVPDTCEEDLYKILIRAGKAINANNFEALPFSGAVDAAGNALDGNKNGRVDDGWFSDNWDPDEFFDSSSDNYTWRFTIEDRVDATAPFLESVVPGAEAESVTPFQNVELIFSKRMLASSLHNILLEQKDVSATPPEERETIPLCYSHLTNYIEGDGGLKTQAILRHCPFLEGKRMFYIPTVTSTVVDVHFNCFFPGKGPAQVNEGNLEPDECLPNSPPGDCCSVDLVTGNVFCCNGETAGEYSQNEATCRSQVEHGI